MVTHKYSHVWHEQRFCRQQLQSPLEERNWRCWPQWKQSWQVNPIPWGTLDPAHDPLPCREWWCSHHILQGVWFPRLNTTGRSQESWDGTCVSMGNNCKSFQWCRLQSKELLLPTPPWGIQSNHVPFSRRCSEARTYWLLMQGKWRISFQKWNASWQSSRQTIEWVVWEKAVSIMTR